MMDICQALLERGHTPIVLTLGGSAFRRTEYIQNVLVERVPMPRLFSLTRYPGILYSIIWVIVVGQKYHVDLIHAHDYLMSLISCLAGRILRKPLVATFHLPIQDTTWIAPKIPIVAPLEELLKVILIRFVCAIICVSQFTRQKTMDLGFPSSKTFVIYNWVSGSKQIVANREPPLNLTTMSDKPTLLCVGRLADSQKGFSWAINAADFLIRKGRNLRLIIVGEGPDEIVYKRLISQLNLSDRIFLAGRVSDAELSQFYRSSDIFVLPSRSEGLPLTLLEAMSVGSLVLATKVGGVPEIITDGRDGVLVVPGWYNLSVAIDNLLRNPSLKEKLGLNAKTTVESRFSLLNCLETIDLLEECQSPVPKTPQPTYFPSSARIKCTKLNRLQGLMYNRPKMSPTSANLSKAESPTGVMITNSSSVKAYDRSSP